MSSKQEPSAPPSLNELAANFDDHSKALQALAAAQEEISQLRDARKEERIGWIAVSVILFDTAMFLNAENSTGPVVIGLLQMAALAMLAKRMGVEEFSSFFFAIAHRFSGIATGKD